MICQNKKLETGPDFDNQPWIFCDKLGKAIKKFSDRNAEHLSSSKYHQKQDMCQLQGSNKLAMEESLPFTFPPSIFESQERVGHYDSMRSF